ncbi:MAG: protein translocase SEC61 complex subunit gamma [Candidatus Njordarchaeales archaeon]
MSGRKIEEYLVNSRRLLRYATKPSRKEIYQISKIIFVTILSIGIIDVVIRLIFNALLGM